MPCRLAPAARTRLPAWSPRVGIAPEASARLGRSHDRQRSAGGPLAVPPPQSDLGGPPSICTKGGKHLEPGQSGRREIGEFRARPDQGADQGVHRKRKPRSLPYTCAAPSSWIRAGRGLLIDAAVSEPGATVISNARHAQGLVPSLVERRLLRDDRPSA